MCKGKAIFIGYRLNMVKYARLRYLSRAVEQACDVCFRSKTEGGHMVPSVPQMIFFIFRFTYNEQFP